MISTLHCPKPFAQRRRECASRAQPPANFQACRQSPFRERTRQSPTSIFNRGGQSLWCQAALVTTALSVLRVLESHEALLQKSRQRVRHDVNVLRRHVRVEREREARIADAFSNGEVAFIKAEGLAEECEQVDGSIVHHDADALRLKFIYHAVTLSAADPDGKEMPGVFDPRKRR